MLHKHFHAVFLFFLKILFIFNLFKFPFASALHVPFGSTQVTFPPSILMFLNSKFSRFDENQQFCWALLVRDLFLFSVA